MCRPPSSPHQCDNKVAKMRASPSRCLHSSSWETGWRLRRRECQAAARSGEGEEERRGERMGATARGSLIHVGTGAVWSAYENTWPDNGPDVAAGVEKGKIV
jgi:hypothetical protein